MMLPVHLIGGQLANQSPDQDIGRKMLLTAHPRIANQTRDTISQNLRQRSGIFVCDHLCNRPRGGGVLRRKRSSVVKKRSSAVALKRPFATKRIFRAFGNY